MGNDGEEEGDQERERGWGEMRDGDRDKEGEVGVWREGTKEREGGRGNCAAALFLRASACV